MNINLSAANMNELALRVAGTVNELGFTKAEKPMVASQGLRVLANLAGHRVEHSLVEALKAEKPEACLPMENPRHAAAFVILTDLVHYLERNYDEDQFDGSTRELMQLANELRDGKLPEAPAKQPAFGLQPVNPNLLHMQRVLESIGVVFDSPAFGDSVVWFVSINDTSMTSRDFGHYELTEDDAIRHAWGTLSLMMSSGLSGYEGWETWPLEAQADALTAHYGLKTVPAPEHSVLVAEAELLQQAGYTFERDAGHHDTWVWRFRGGENSVGFASYDAAVDAVWLELASVSFQESGLSDQALDQLQPNQVFDMVRKYVASTLQRPQAEPVELSMTEAIAELQQRWGGEQGMHGEHPHYCRSDWQYQVSNADTHLGYWEWVVHQIEMNGGDENHCSECGKELDDAGWDGLCGDCADGVSTKASNADELIDELGFDRSDIEFWVHQHYLTDFELADNDDQERWIHTYRQYHGMRPLDSLAESIPSEIERVALEDQAQSTQGELPVIDQKTARAIKKHLGKEGQLLDVRNQGGVDVTHFAIEDEDIAKFPCLKGVAYVDTWKHGIEVFPETGNSFEVEL